MRDINEEIGDFIESIEDIWLDGPLDGDVTEHIALRIQLELDKLMGNITDKEYKKILHKLNKVKL